MSISLRSFVVFCATVSLFACGCAGPSRDDPDAAFATAARRAFDSPDVSCLVLIEHPSGRSRAMNPLRATERFSPASSFKIPNALIGLETGAIPDADHVIAWDGTRHERELNNRKHSLRSAFSYSVVWYFQELARRVGEPRMRSLVDAFNYGNRDISSGLTTFWLRGSIRISANEQAAFLQRLIDGTLPVSPRTASTVKDVLVLAQGPGWTYRGKTGTYSGPVDGVESDLGWFVGWVECDRRTVIFAANDGSPGTSGPDVRAKVERFLVDLGELPPDWERHRREVPLPF